MAQQDYIAAFKTTLTHEEQQWLKDHPVIHMGVDSGYAPYSFQEESGEYRGIAMEFSQLVSEMLGIKLQVVPGLSWVEIVDATKTQNIDVILTAVKTEERESFLHFTPKYLPTPLVIMSQAGNNTINEEADIKGKKVTLVRGYSSSAEVMAKYPSITVHEVNEPLEGLWSLATGESDAYVGVLGINVHLGRINGISNIKVASKYGDGMNGQRMAVRKDIPELAAILTKALKAIPSDVASGFFAKWLPVSSEVDLHQQPLNLTETEKKWVEAKKEINVMFTGNNPPFEFVGQFDDIKGIGVDFIKEFAKQMGLKVNLVYQPEFTQSNFDEVAIYSGEYGFMNEVDRSFSVEYISHPYVLVSNQQNTQVENISEIKGHVLTVEKGSYLQTYFRENYPEYHFLEVDNALQGLRAVTENPAVVYVGSSLVASHYIEKHLIHGLRVATLPSIQPINFQLVVGNQDKVLYELLQKSLNNISVSKRWKIINRYVNLIEMENIDFVQLRDEISLTAEEKIWLKEHPNIRLGVDPEFAPFEFFNDEGNYKGMCAEYVSLVAKRLGVNVEIVEGLSWPEVIINAKSKEVDVLPCVGKTQERKKYLDYTMAHLAFPRVVVARMDDQKKVSLENLSELVVAVQENSSHHGFLQENTALTPLLFETAAEAIHAVSNGEADVFIGNKAAAVYTMHHEALQNLEVLDEQLGGFNYLYFAVRNDWPILVDILNKGLQSINLEEANTIQSRWMTQQGLVNMGAGSYSDKHFLKDLLILVLAFFISMSLIAVFLKYRR